MPRIQPVITPCQPALQQRFDKIVPAGMTPPAIFRAVARNEGLFMHMVDTGWLGPSGLLDRRTLPRALRELLILRTCMAARNDYEWHLHVDTISERMGLSSAQIADTRSDAPTAALWNEPQLAALRMADALVRRVDIDDTLYATLRQHFDEPTLIEMTQLVGLYTGVAMLVALTRPDRDDYRSAGG